MDPSDGYKGNSLRVPPLIVNTSGLETYLSKLSSQLSHDIYTLRKRVDECNTKISNSSDTVSKVKRFLLVNARKKMEECLFGTYDDGNDGEVDHFINEIITEDVQGPDGEISDSELFVAMLAVATKLARNNANLKAALRESLETTRTFMKDQDDLQHQLRELRARMDEHRHDFDGLSTWLGTYDAEAHMTRLPPFSPSPPPGDYGVGASELCNPGISAEVEKAVDGMFARSPLLLALRRVITRDLHDRLAHWSELNAREVAGAMARVKSQIPSPSSPPSLVAAMTTPEAQKLATALVDYDRRIRQIEAGLRLDRSGVDDGKSANPPGSFFSLVSNPQSIGARPSKDFAPGRWADFEERLVYLESEREEFRGILRALLGSRPEPHVIPASLREQLTHYAMGASGRDSRTCGYSPIDRIHGKRIFPTAEMILAKEEAGNYPNGAASSNTAKEPVGVLSESQTTYGRYITDVFNRKDVNRLPPLPYESLLKK
ncbi:unnamed protein product [Phytomonas sp. Hart1]|nr:unnamed protein product [Phytomonas sp. Hart1]|eukprot:CCW69362.1 unnamed protein product [Phytomonas sp. isolate Hart1]